MKGILAVVYLVVAAAPAARADQPDPYHMAETAYLESFAPDGGGVVHVGRLDEMWRLSPTRSLAALRRKIDEGGEMALAIVAMGASQVHDPRFLDFLVEQHRRASPAARQDLVRMLTPYDGADDHLEPWLRGLPQPPESVTRALELIDARERLGYDDTAKLVAEIAAADYVPLADQAILRGLSVRLDGEVPAEGELRTMVDGTRVVARFERDREAEVAYAPTPEDWVHLEGRLRTIHPAADERGKIVELELSYAALSPSTAPRRATTPAAKSGCCDGGGGAAGPLALLLVLTSLRSRASTRGGRSRDRSSRAPLPSR